MEIMRANVKKTKVMVVVETQREAIKAAPIIELLLRRTSDFEPIVVAISHTDEHLLHTLTLFHLSPNIVLHLKHIRQGLPSLTSHTLENMTVALENTKPDILLAQGNSTSAFSSALAAFNQKIAVAHIASGPARPFSDHPFPQDVNRRLTSVMAEIHFAPTRWSKHGLVSEGVSEKKILVTGNPLIDALKHLSAQPFSFADKTLQNAVDNGKRLVLFAIRNASSPAQWHSAVAAAHQLVGKYAHVDVVLPRAAQVIARSADLSGHADSIHLIDPPDEMTFFNLLKHSHLIVTDSDYLPEEASIFQKPVLLLQTGQGGAKGVYTVSTKDVAWEASAIALEAGFLLNNDGAWRKMRDAENPYGDGAAAQRIVTAIQRWAKHQRTLLTLREEFSCRNPLTDLLRRNL